MVHYIAIVLAIWNFIVFIVYGVDKRLAIRHMQRISEKRLLLLALCLGALGASFGAIVFNHKVSKWKFRIILPILLIINAFVYGYCYFYFGM